MDTTALRTWFDALPQDAKEEFEEFVGVKDGYDFDNQVKTVLEFMAGYGMADEAPGCSRMSWTAERDGDGSIAGWNIGVTTTDHAWYLYQYVEWDEITEDGSATGLEQAWGIAVTVAGLVEAAMALAEAKQL